MLNKSVRLFLFVMLVGIKNANCQYLSTIDHMYTLVDNELGELSEERENVSHLRAPRQVSQPNTVPPGAARDQ